MVFCVCVCCSTSGHYRSCVLEALCVCMLSPFSHVHLFAILWTVALQAPLSTGFSRHEYWSVLPCPPPGDLPDSGIESASIMSPALAGGFFTTSATWEAPLKAAHSHHFCHPFSFLWNPLDFASCLLKQNIGLHRLADMCLCVYAQVCWGGR